MHYGLCGVILCFFFLRKRIYTYVRVTSDCGYSSYNVRVARKLAVLSRRTCFNRDSNYDVPVILKIINVIFILRLRDDAESV